MVMHPNRTAHILSVASQGRLLNLLCSLRRGVGQSPTKNTNQPIQPIS